MQFTLPYPPTINTYWRRVGNRTVMSKRGREYRQEVMAMLMELQPPKLSCPLSVHVTAHPPDRRRRDLDNISKALLDALTHGGAYEDDSQIHRLSLEWGERLDGGLVVVEIEEYQRKAG